MSQHNPKPRMAVDCRWLKRSLDSARRDPYAMCCAHIVREGDDCVGPFLDDMETGCGLWEPGEPAAARARRLGSGHP